MANYYQQNGKLYSMPFFSPLTESCENEKKISFITSNKTVQPFQKKKKETTKPISTCSISCALVGNDEGSFN